MKARVLIIGAVLMGVCIFASVLKPGVGQTFKVTPGAAPVAKTGSATSLKATAAETLKAQLDTLAQTGATDALIAGEPAGLPAIGGDATDAGLEDLIARAPALAEAEKQAVVSYLTAAAKVDMPTPDLVTFAILQARDNKPAEIIGLAPRIQAAADSLGAITPPAALTEYHGASVLNLRAYANALSAVAAKTGQPAEMLTALNSPAYNAARQEARSLLKNLRALILKNEIIVGSGVLPSTALP